MPHAISISQGKPRCRFYAGNIELACWRGRYLNGQIQHIAFPDGRLVAEYDAGGTSVTGYRAEYFRTDHLGNTARAEIPSRVSYYADSIRRIKTPF